MKQTNYYLFAFSIIFVAVLSGCGAKFKFDGIPNKKKPDPIKKITESVQVTSTQKVVDILVITDDSFSMESEQERLSERFSSFIQDLSAVDWQMGITTTDIDSGGLQGELSNFSDTSLKIINAATPNAEQLFKDTVQREEFGSSDEQPLAAAIKAMEKRDSVNQGFFRDDANLAIVVLTDEDELSDGPRGATQPQAVIDKFSSIWGGAEKQLRVYGLIIEPGDTACYDYQNEHGGWGATSYGTFVANLASATGGLTGSICQSDYSSTLQTIGQNIDELFRSYTLSDTPKPGSLEIRMIPRRNIPWTISDKLVTFDSVVPAGTEIRFTYEKKLTDPDTDPDNDPTPDDDDDDN